MNFCPPNFFRGLVTFGLVLLTSWTALKTCSGPWFIYNIIALAINAVYFFTLAIKHFPVIVPKNMEGVYTKMFKPLNMGKKVSLTVENVPKMLLV